MADSKSKSKSSSSSSSSKSSSSSSGSSKKSDPREAKAVGATIDDTSVSGDEAALHGHYVTVEKGDHKGERAVVIAATTDDDNNVQEVVLRTNDAPLATFTVPYSDVKRDDRLGV